MKTQKIKVEIEAEVPVGKYCKDCIHAPIASNKCDLFAGTFLDYDGTEVSYLKHKKCLEACANGTERALKELAGEGEGG